MTTCEEFVKHAFYEKFHSKPTTECRSTDKLYAGWSDAGYIVTYPDKKVVTYVYDVEMGYKVDAIERNGTEGDTKI